MTVHSQARCCIQTLVALREAFPYQWVRSVSEHWPRGGSLRWRRGDRDHPLLLAVVTSQDSLFGLPRVAQKTATARRKGRIQVASIQQHQPPLTKVVWRAEVRRQRSLARCGAVM